MNAVLMNGKGKKIKTALAKTQSREEDSKKRKALLSQRRGDAENT